MLVVGKEETGDELSGDSEGTDDGVGEKGELDFVLEGVALGVVDDMTMGTV